MSTQNANEGLGRDPARAARPRADEVESARRAELRPTIPPLIPPFRHSMVEEGVYRGAHPSLKNMRFLRRLNLRTMLSLATDKSGPPRDLTEYCATERIRHVWFVVDKYDDGFSHTPALVAAVVSELIEPRNHPVYLHCRDGGHNTGLIVMCLRRLQNWSLPAIYHEFRRYTKSNELSFAERHFVESFQETVSVPVCIPRWLWDGVRHRRHPSIRLRLERDPGTPASAQSPSASVGRELDGFAASSGGMMPVREEVEASDSAERLRCRHVRMRYSNELAALDLHGVHLRRYRKRVSVQE